MPPAEQLYAENLSLQAELKKTQSELAQAQAQLAWLKRKVFGGSMSERFVETAGQQTMPFVATVPAPPLPVKPMLTERSPRQPKPRATPAEAFAHLPVKETIEIVPVEVQAAPEQYEQIAVERTFEVDIVPPKLFKREILRPKYRRKDERSLPPAIAPAPVRAVPGGYASAGLIAYIVVSKYQHHLPLYRLEKMSAHWGAQLSRQSLCEWVRVAAQLAEPIYNRLQAELLASGYVQCDETPIKYIDPDDASTQTRKGYLWVLSKPGGDVVFYWATSRHHHHVHALLGKAYQGLLQSDGYEAYKDYAQTHSGVTWLACWAHARREIYQAQTDHPRLATRLLELIREMYARERSWDEQALTPAQRREARRDAKTGLAPLFTRLRRLALWTRRRLLPQLPLAKACAYLLRQWDGLRAHLDHGHTRLDNNLVENALRPSCIGKKNFLFIGHPQAGDRSAILYSLIVSCERHGKDPLVYLRDLFSRLPAMTNQDDLSALLPSRWQPPETVTLAP